MSSPAPNRTRRLALRFSLLGILVVALAGWGYDRYARESSRTAYVKLRDLLPPVRPKPPKGPAVTPQQVREVIGAEPDGEPVPEGEFLHEDYSWRGALLTYTVHVVYKAGDPPALDDVELNYPGAVDPFHVRR